MDLSTYVDAWAETADRTIALLRDLDADELAHETGLPGWSVREVVAHLAAVESELAGTGRGGPTDVENSGGVMGSDYVEAGVALRAGVAAEDLVDELAEAVAVRREALTPAPSDPDALAHERLGWSWDTLLRNRLIDIWVHEQDVRRALGRPGGYDGVPAQVVTRTFTMALPFVLGKKVGAAPGTSVVVKISGPVAETLVVAVGEDGRARLVDSVPEAPTATLALDTDTFVLLATGRRALAPVAPELSGDLALAGAVLANLAVTP